MRLCLVLVFCLVFVVAVVVLADPSHGESRSSQSQVSSEESKKVRRPRDKEASGKSNKEEVGKKRKSKETNADAKDKKSPKSTKKVNPQKVKKIKKTKSVLYGKGKKSGRQPGKGKKSGRQPGKGKKPGRQPGKGKKPGRQPGKNKLRKKHRKTKTMEGGSIDTLQTECPGECIKSGEECQSGVVLQEGCQKGFQCCDAGDLEEKAGVKRCRCRTKQKCSNKKGACQNARQQCNGRLVKNNKKFCRGRKCACCIPPKPCKLKRKCFNAGGVCQAKTAACEGETITTRGFCRGKCLCCLPKAAAEEEEKPEEEGEVKRPKWSYHGDNGPEHWSENFPMCGGRRQSPLDLLTGTSVNQTSWHPFRFINYDRVPSNMTIVNNGHTVIVMLEMEDRPKVSGGGLVGEYEFIQMHFHWGSNDSTGSEHQFDHKSYACELHLVHYSLDYGTVEEAVQYSDGLAVLGIMFNVEDFENINLHNLLSGLVHIHNPGTNGVIQPFPLSHLLPEDTRRFFRYEGSLTTPPCTEVVVWTVFLHSIPISLTQVTKYRMLLEDEALPLQDNFRPVQTVHDRQVHNVQTAW